MVEIRDEKVQDYCIYIQELVAQLKKKSKKAVAENEQYIIPFEEAKQKYGARKSEVFYRFEGKAPSQELIDAYERAKYQGSSENFEQHLSHRQMTVIFDGQDLVIKKERGIYIGRLTERDLRDYIDVTEIDNIIELDKAKIYVFPYKTIYFFISDSFEPSLSGRSDTGNPDNWITFPFTQDFDYSEMRKTIRDYAEEHPLEEEVEHVHTINVYEIFQKVLAEKMAEAEKETTNDETPLETTVETPVEPPVETPQKKSWLKRMYEKIVKILD